MTLLGFVTNAVVGAFVLGATCASLLIYGVTRRSIRRIVRQADDRLAEEMATLKSQLIANLSHEVRTPLMLIMGPVDDLLRNTRDPDQIRHLTNVQHNARRLLSLVNDLLDLSRLDAGEAALQVQRTEYLSLVVDIVERFAERATRKGVTLHIDPPVSRINGSVDRVKVERAIGNIVSNAIKFTPAGGVVTVGLREEDGNAIVTVRDTGAGIAARNRGRVGQRFFRDDPTHANEGAGIGLAVATELVQLHHGSIHLSSIEHEGTTINVRLPLRGYAADECKELNSYTRKEDWDHEA